jgi:hypothetical protein
MTKPGSANGRLYHGSLEQFLMGWYMPSMYREHLGFGRVPRTASKFPRYLFNLESARASTVWAWSWGLVPSSGLASLVACFLSAVHAQLPGLHGTQHSTAQRSAAQHSTVPMLASSPDNYCTYSTATTRFSRLPASCMMPHAEHQRLRTEPPL